MSKKIIAAFAAAFLFLTFPFPTVASDGDSYERKIVIFDSAVKQKTREEVISRFGHRIKDLRLINGMVAQIPVKSKRDLRQQPGVLRVEDDMRVFTLEGPIPIQPGQTSSWELVRGHGARNILIPSAFKIMRDARALIRPRKELKPPQQSEQLPWGIDRIDAEQAWATSRGVNVKVAVIDTGIDLAHPDLKENIKGGYNAIKPTRELLDDNGHGTRVAGIIAAADNDIGVIGASNGAEIYAVKALYGNGLGYGSDVIESLQWCIANKMHIANMSFGVGQYSQALHDAVKAAYNAGLVIVAAAGNSGAGPFSTVNYPARFDEVIAVSALSKNDSIASFSSRGPEVDIAAPGDQVLTTYKNAGYGLFSGSSAAAPHVAGAIALRLQLNLALAPRQVMDLLKQAAKPLQNATSDEVGFGLVDALALANVK